MCAYIYIYMCVYTYIYIFGILWTVGSLELRPVSVVLLLLLSFSLVVFVLYRFGGLLSKCFHCVLKGPSHKFQSG